MAGASYLRYKDVINWSPLTSEHDPVPGDPEAIQDAITSITSTADAIEEVADGVRNISEDGQYNIQQSQAVDAWADTATRTASKLKDAEPRYRTAADALDDYHTALIAAQAEAVAALADAQQAKAASDALDHEIAADPHPQITNPDGTQSPDEATRNDRNTRRATADQVLTNAKKALTDAQEAQQSAAEKAANKIENKITNDKVKDSFWDNIKVVWKQVADVLSTISTVLGVLALFVAVIPVIGQALAGVFGAVALITGVLALALHLVYALAEGDGWGDVFWDALGVITFGVGRAAGAGAKAFASTSRFSATSKLLQISKKPGPVMRTLNSPEWKFLKTQNITKSEYKAYKEAAGPLSVLHPREWVRGAPQEFMENLRTIRSGTGQAWSTVRAGEFSRPTFNVLAMGEDASKALDNMGDMRKFIESMRVEGAHEEKLAVMGVRLENIMKSADTANAFKKIAVTNFRISLVGTFEGVAEMAGFNAQ